jgi:ribose 5-phosphate isomerase RpiB
MTSAPRTDIERIVREVLTELGIGRSAPATLAASAPGGPTPKEPIATASPRPAQAVREAAGEVKVDARVVTMADVVGRLQAVRRLVVAQQAIVTPAVQDELRRRNVVLVRVAKETARQASLPRIVVVAARTKHEPASLVHVLSREGFEVESHVSDCLIASTDQLAEELMKSNTLGILWTSHTAVGLCLANRHEGVRAVLASDVPGTAADAAAVGANLLVLCPQCGTVFQQKQMVREFCVRGVRECPEALKKRLG